jgi:hypothetical protein
MASFTLRLLCSRYPMDRKLDMSLNWCGCDSVEKIRGPAMVRTRSPSPVPAHIKNITMSLLLSYLKRLFTLMKLTSLFRIKIKEMA